MFNKGDDLLLEEAKNIAKATTDDPVLRKYIEGLNFRVLKLERSVSGLTLNFWILFFVIFILPMFFRTT